MSFGGSLLSSYPSTLLSDEYVQRTTLDSMYPAPISYLGNNRFIESDLNFNRAKFQTTSYNAGSGNAYFPSRFNDQQNLSGPSSWRGSIPGQESHTSIQDMTEYSESMATASNTNTASSIARTIEETNHYGPTKKITKNQPISNNFRSNPATQQTNNFKPNSKKETIPKKTLNDKSNTNTSMGFELENPGNHRADPQTQSSAYIEAWLNDTKKDDDPVAEQAWSIKVNQMHMAQAQRAKEKTRSSHFFGNDPKKLETKPFEVKTKTDENNPERRTTTYMDSLFDGDYFKPVHTNFSGSTSFQSSKPKRTKPLNNSFSQNYEEFPSKPAKLPTKKSQPTRPPRYEPPTNKRQPPPITTSSWRTNLPPTYLYDSWTPYYYQPDLINPDFVHKDEEERFREALHVLRAEKAEQKQKQTNEATAKRLTYGDYVRSSTKEGSLQNPVKPSPWSDFMDMKKGNLYSLSREEKKQRYNQSKSYGERVRHRNIGFYSDGETGNTHRYSNPYVDDFQESETSNLTPRQIKNEINSKSVSQTSKRVDSTSKKHRPILKTVSRTSDFHRSDDEDDAHSDTEIQLKQKRLTKKKSLNKEKLNSSRLSKSDSSQSDTDGEKRSVRFRLRPKTDQLFTLREERTLESIDGSRTKRNNVKQRK